MNFLPIVIPQVFYLAESKADLQMVERFLLDVEQNFFRLRRPNGGSNEYYEAVMTLGTQTMGVRYVSPREGFAGLDGFVVSAFTSTKQLVVRIDLAFNTGESKWSATSRWIQATRTALLNAAQFAQLPYAAIQNDCGDDNNPQVHHHEPDDDAHRRPFESTGDDADLEYFL